MLLAGDVGGTKTNLACFEVEGGRLKPVVADTFSSRAHASLDEIVRQFVSTHDLRVEHAGFGIVGGGGQCRRHRGGDGAGRSRSLLGRQAAPRPRSSRS